MTREARLRGKPFTGQPREVSALMSQKHMVLRWDNDVPARLGDVLPGWHPGWTPTTWLMGGPPACGQTAS